MRRAKAEARERPLTVALVGAGRMATHHADAIGRIEQARLIAVAEPHGGAREHLIGNIAGARGWPDLSSLLADEEVDVVHVCTPPDTHGPLAREALEGGAHVYVEKPFASSLEDARAVLDLARERGLRVCAGHQLLFEAPSQKARELREAAGTICHLESFFAFRPARTQARPLTAVEQLLDVLPHPVYVLLDFLQAAAAGERSHLETVELGREGTLHALVRRGELVGTLLVTLSGRPVESYLEIVGTRGRIRADFVRGTVQHALGPGSSGIDKALQPYRTARQLMGGTTGALARRLLDRGSGYPGLTEIFEAFYESILSGAPPPVSEDNILDTVRICAEIGQLLDGSASPHSLPDQAEDARGGGRANFVVTGGTGFLGEEIVRRLREEGRAVRVLSRRPPAPWERVEGTKYTRCDLAAGVDPELLRGAEAVIHCAAETSGGWEAHERNSVQATERLLRAAAQAGVSGFLHVSSLAVLSSEAKEPLAEDAPLETGRGSGPYVWGKAESERVAVRLGEELGVNVRVARPGAIIDYRDFDPPGRLGKRLGNIFVAVGSAGDRLGVVDRSLASRTIVWMATHFDEAPTVLHILNPRLPTKEKLLENLRAHNPELRVLRLPSVLLWPLSQLAFIAQKLLLRDREPIKLHEVFRARIYTTDRMERMAAELS